MRKLIQWKKQLIKMPRRMQDLLLIRNGVVTVINR